MIGIADVQCKRIAYYRPCLLQFGMEKDPGEMHTGARLGAALDEAMRLKGVTQAEVAAAFGVKQPSVSEWIKFGRIGKKHITRLVQYFSVQVGPEHWGLPPSWGASVPEAPPTDPSNVYEITPRKRVPLIDWIRAGHFGDIEDNHHAGEADEWVDVYDTKPGESSFALRVTGDSMTSPHPGERSFPEGTVIVVDPLRGATAGDYVVAKDVMTQKATFKKLTTDGGRWFLKPLNPSYPIVEIDDPALRVIGRVIEAVTRQKL